MLEDFFGKGLGALGGALLIVAWIIVTYLNAHDDRMIEKAKIQACSNQPAVVACIKAVK